MIVNAAMIMHDALQSPITFKDSLQEDDGRWFAKISKGDSSSRRLLLAKVADKPAGNNLACTDILEHLLNLRNSAIADLVGEAAEAQERESGEFEDLGIDAPAPKAKKQKLDVAIPKIGTIQAPTINHIEGPIIGVYMQRTKALWLELTPTVIDYLMDVVASQISANSIEPVGRAHSSDIDGTIWNASRSTYIVRYKQGETKKSKNFKLDGINDDEIKSKVRQFINDLESA